MLTLSPLVCDFVICQACHLQSVTFIENQDDNDNNNNKSLSSCRTRARIDICVTAILNTSSGNILSVQLRLCAEGRNLQKEALFRREYWLRKQARDSLGAKRKLFARKTRATKDGSGWGSRLRQLARPKSFIQLKRRPSSRPATAEGLFSLLCVADRVLPNRCFFFFFPRRPRSELVALTRAFLQFSAFATHD